MHEECSAVFPTIVSPDTLFVSYIYMRFPLSIHYLVKTYPFLFCLTGVAFSVQLLMTSVWGT